MQKASLGILAILLLCISCNFSPKKSQEAASTPEAVITSANTKPMTEEERLDAELDSIAAALEAKAIRDRQQTDSIQQELARRAAIRKWYEKDFSIKIVRYETQANGKRKSGSEEKTYTRIGNNVYLHDSNGISIRDIVMEYRAEGGRKVRIYENGALTKSYEDDSPSPEKYLLFQFTSPEEKHPILAGHPAAKNAETEEILHGRLCAVVTRVEEQLGPQFTNTDIFWIDKEVGYIAKQVSFGTMAGTKTAEISNYEVTYFTDQPTEKDIYRK